MVWGVGRKGKDDEKQGSGLIGLVGSDDVTSCLGRAG